VKIEKSVNDDEGLLNINLENKKSDAAKTNATSS
jgi:hypothetical protein